MLLDGLAALLNRNIAASARARMLCARLEGRSLGIAAQALLPVTVHVRVANGTLQLSRTAEGTPDAMLCGTPLALLALAGRDAQERLRNGAVSVEGDAETVQSFHELLLAARPELEEELSRIVGDVTAHQLGNLARAAAGWGRSTAATFATNVAEYLQEESRDLVTHPEAEEFAAGVDELRERTDRLAARIDRLAAPARR